MSCSISVRLSHKELFALVTPLEVQVHLKGPVLDITEHHVFGCQRYFANRFLKREARVGACLGHVKIRVYCQVWISSGVSIAQETFVIEKYADGAC